MNKYKKVQFISPPSNRTIEGQQKWARYFQPIGLLSIATYVNEILPDVEIEFLDFECILDLDNPENTQLIGNKSVLVAISMTLSQVDRGLDIAKIAHERGADVVLGGNIVTALHERILKYHPFVDYCVRYDGEDAMLELIRGSDLKKVPNLVWKDGQNIIHNEIVQVDLSKLPIINRDLIDFEEYMSQTDDPEFKPLPFFSRPANMYSLKGCSWRSTEGGGCYFCSIPDKGLRARDPKQVWDERRQLVEKYNVNYIWDPTDNFLADRKWFRDFYELKPKDFVVPFSNYIRIDYVDHETAKMLREIGCVQVFMGMESGSDEALKSLNKGITKEMVDNSLNILRENEITAVLGIVIGAKGETQETVIETLEYMKYLLEVHPNLDRFEWGTLAPLPGSKAFDEMLKHPVLKEKYAEFGKGNIMSTLEQMIEDWPEYMCDDGVDFDYFLYIQQLAQEHLPYKMTRYQKRAWNGTPHKAYINGELIDRDDYIKDI